MSCGVVNVKGKSVQEAKKKLLTYGIGDKQWQNKKIDTAPFVYLVFMKKPEL
jgi:hypothetical protein